MAEKTWKYHERRIARLLGVPKSTRIGYPGPDLANPFLAVDVKFRTRFPSWVGDHVRKVKSYAQSHQLPILVLAGPTEPDDLVVMTLRDFRDWLTAGSPSPEREEEIL